MLCVSSHHVSADINLNDTCTTVFQIGTGIGTKMGMFILLQKCPNKIIIPSFNFCLHKYSSAVEPSNYHNVVTWNETERDYWSTKRLPQSKFKQLQGLHFVMLKQLGYSGHQTRTKGTNFTIKSDVINTVRTGLLNCLNARSRGLNQSEVRFL